MAGLGYMGTDIVLDRRRGPQLLELNARPGLSIQVANGMGLLPRLRHIERLKPDLHTTAEQRVDYVQKTFRASADEPEVPLRQVLDRKSTRLNSSHVAISYAVFCLKQK